MVKVISTVPHSSVVRQCNCKQCGATLEYTPIEIKEKSYRDYDGGYDVDYHINCPTCEEKVFVRKY